MVEFWDEGDAIRAEEAMHCAEVEGQNIVVQVYQPRRPAPEFNVAAPAFVPTSLAYSPYPTQVRPRVTQSVFVNDVSFSILPRAAVPTRLSGHPFNRRHLSYTDQVNKCSSLLPVGLGRAAIAVSSIRAIFSVKWVATHTSRERAIDFVLEFEPGD